MSKPDSNRSLNLKNSGLIARSTHLASSFDFTFSDDILQAINNVFMTFDPEFRHFIIIFQFLDDLGCDDVILPGGG